MPTDSVAIASRLAERAQQALDDGRPFESLDLFERAYTVAVSGNNAMPIAFKLLQRQAIPQLSSEQHIIAYISRQGIVFAGMIDFIAHPCSDFRRFPMIGHICSNVAQTISGSETFECIFDIGDGMDTGDYARIAYSSALPQAALILDPYFYIYDNYNDLRIRMRDHATPWRDRKDILFWRGTTTGQRRHTPSPNAPLSWDWLPRLQLCAASRSSRHALKMDIAITEMGQIGEEYLKNNIISAGFIGKFSSKFDFSSYKYLIDIDGHSNSWSLIEKFIMGATVFKVRSPKGYRQWYYRRLRDWETHIPIASDLSDLDDIMDWALSHPEECERIAANGAALAAEVQLSSALREAERALSGNWTLA